MTKMTEETTLENILRVVEERTGWRISNARQRGLISGVNRAMAHAGITVPKIYAQAIVDAPVLFDALVMQLTVSETYFFRHAAQFDFIRDTVIPDIRRRKGSKHRIRAWSAGCASGEEPYSLAILFEQLGVAHEIILATDLDGASLRKAEAGSYTKWSFRSTYDFDKDRYLRSDGKTSTVVDSIRDKVTFRRLNLAEGVERPTEAAMSDFDIIFCRNVLIYFDTAAIAVTTERLLSSLAVGGWLIAGPSDPALPKLLPFETIFTGAGTAYRRLASLPQHPPTERRAATAALPPIRFLPSEEIGISQFRLRPDMVGGDTDIQMESISNAKPAQLALTGRRAKQEHAFSKADYEAVLKLTERADCAEEYTIRFHALTNMGRKTEALNALSAAAAQFPLNIEIHLLRAMTFMENGNLDAAASAARKAVYLDRQQIAGHMLLGLILVKTKDKEGAFRAFRSARDMAARCPEDERVPHMDGMTASQIVQATNSELANSIQFSEASA